MYTPTLKSMKTRSKVDEAAVSTAQEATLNVLGVDPGSQATGWGMLGGSAAAPELRNSGLIRLDSRLAMAERLARLQEEFRRLVERLSPAAAAVESPFHGPGARSALQLAQARGVILAVLASAGVEVAEYTPTAVKKSVTGNGRAGKEQVRSMVCRLVGIEDSGQAHDISDAIAVALCHLTTARFRAAVMRAENSR
jgi:crossover junction endodeoxyribonuclease RuvC